MSVGVHYSNVIHPYMSFLFNPFRVVNFLCLFNPRIASGAIYIRSLQNHYLKIYTMNVVSNPQKNFFRGSFLFNPFRVVNSPHSHNPGLHPGPFIFDPFRIRILKAPSLKDLNINGRGCNPRIEG